MDSISRMIAQLKASGENFTVEALADVLDAKWIEDALVQSQRRSQRRRLLPAELVVWALILLAVFRRHSYTNLLGMLGSSLWAQRYWPSGPPSSSALTQARDRLGVEPLKLLYEMSSSSFLDATPGMRVGELRLMAIDGSMLRMPDCPDNREFFGLPPSSRGRSAYPMMRIVTLIDVGSRITVDERHGPYRTGELTLARSLIQSVPSDALVIMDRYFGAYGFLADLRHGGAHFLVRLRRNVKFHTVRHLGPGDRLVQVKLHPALRRQRPDLPSQWVLRELTYCPKPGHEAIRLLTSVIDPTMLSLKQAASSYGQRWGHETAFDEQKTHLMDRTTVNRPVIFRSMNPLRVEQELYGLLIAHSTLRMLIHRAARKTGQDEIRVSFVYALERLREGIRDMMTLKTLRLPQRYRALLKSMASEVVPKRRGRSNPREVKIKMSGYPCKMTRLAAHPAA